MRRPLPCATAVCVVSALVFVLGAAAPAPTDTQTRPPLAADVRAPGTSVSGPGVPEHQQSHRQLGRTAAPSGQDNPPEPSGVTEVESSLSAFVDQAFPDRPQSDSGSSSVGIGHLAWDREYTRRALFRFPVELDHGTVVHSAALRTEVVWSYDCVSPSSLELHRVDPFSAGVVWNDQPTAHALLDTRHVRGGQPSCPVDGGVEFDVTEAVQWAVDHREPHVHLRIAESTESGTAAWSRIDVGDAPPSLVIDHGPATLPNTDTGAHHDHDQDRDAQKNQELRDTAPRPPARDAAQVPDDDLTGGNALATPVTGFLTQGRPGREGVRVRSRRGERADRPTATRGHRRPGSGTVPRARGPPITATGNRLVPGFRSLAPVSDRQRPSRR